MKVEESSSVLDSKRRKEGPPYLSTFLRPLVGAGEKNSKPLFSLTQLLDKVSS